MSEPIILEGVLMSHCRCGKCNVPNYPYRTYDRRWSCISKSWVRGYMFEYELFKISWKSNEPLIVGKETFYTDTLTLEKFEEIVDKNPKLLNRLY